MKQPPQGCGRVPIIVGFQDVIGQSARWSNLGPLSYEKLDQMDFWGPFQPRLVYEYMN